MDNAVDQNSQVESRGHAVLNPGVAGADVKAPDMMEPSIHRHHEDVEEVCPFCLFIISSKDIRTEQKWR
jgi:hypothetical protein